MLINRGQRYSTIIFYIKVRDKGTVPSYEYLESSETLFRNKKLLVCYLSSTNDSYSLTSKLTPLINL